MRSCHISSVWPILVLVITLFPVSKLYSQSGAWIPYYADTLGRGDAVFDAGDKCAVFTRANSPYFLIYNSKTGGWQLIKFGTNQYFT